MGHLLARCGQVQGQDMRGNAVVINAMVPLANMFGYVRVSKPSGTNRLKQPPWTATELAYIGVLSGTNQN